MLESIFEGDLEINPKLRISKFFKATLTQDFKRAFLFTRLFFIQKKFKKNKTQHVKKIVLIFLTLKNKPKPIVD